MRVSQHLEVNQSYFHAIALDGARFAICVVQAYRAKWDSILVTNTRVYLRHSNLFLSTQKIYKTGNAGVGKTCDTERIHL